MVSPAPEDVGLLGEECGAVSTSDRAEVVVSWAVGCLKGIVELMLIPRIRETLDLSGKVGPPFIPHLPSFALDFGAEVS